MQSSSPPARPRLAEVVILERAKPVHPRLIQPLPVDPVPFLRGRAGHHDVHSIRQCQGLAGPLLQREREAGARQLKRPEPRFDIIGSRHPLIPPA